MTNDQRDRLNRFLATEVLKWKVGDYEPDEVSVYFEGNDVSRPVCCWEPCQSLADCEPLLYKIAQDKWYWTLDNTTDGGYGCAVWNHVDAGHGWSKDSPTEALCLAIARAYGWKEEA